MKMGEKAISLLRIASVRGGACGSFDESERAFAERDRLYAEACDRYSEKAVDRKFQELCDRGYMDYGVSARTGWLTEKGRMALASQNIP